MQHSAYVNGADIHVGTVISIAIKNISPGDDLTLEFPHNKRVPCKVISALPNELEVHISNETWRLRPHAPSDTQPHSNMTGIDASFWTVQTKL